MSANLKDKSALRVRKPSARPRKGAMVKPAVAAEGMHSRLQQRRERFLIEAERLFLEKGFAGASVNEIVERAGGSLSTLYSEFGDKEALFEAVMRKRSTTFFDSQAARLLANRDTRNALIAVAIRHLDRILLDDAIAVYRLAVSEGPRFPELRRTILEVSMRGFLSKLGQVLQDLGVATADSSLELAQQFVALVHGQLLFRAACGDGAALTKKIRVEHAERAVDAFLAIQAQGRIRKE